MSATGSIFKSLPGFILLALLCWFGYGPAACAADDLRVLMVLSDGQKLYQNFANSFQQNLPANIQIAVVERAEDFSSETHKADLILSVGVKAAEAVAGKGRTPLLAAMIPRNKYQDLAAKHLPAQISAVYVDQPWSRQADLIRAALPERSKVGVLHSPATRLNLGDLRKQLEMRGASLVTRQVTSSASLFEDLEDILARSEVLLVVPDSEIYNSNNIRNILLTSYRHGIPLVGISQAYVNAGALCALFSTPEQLAAQARTMTIVYGNGRNLPDAQHAATFSIAVNPEVARTLGEAIKPVESLLKEIDKSRRTAQ